MLMPVVANHSINLDINKNCIKRFFFGGGGAVNQLHFVLILYAVEMGFLIQSIEKQKQFHNRVCSDTYLIDCIINIYQPVTINQHTAQKKKRLPLNHQMQTPDRQSKLEVEEINCEINATPSIQQQWL